MQSDSRNYTTILKLAVVMLSVLVIVFAVYQVIVSRRFHVVSTNPSVHNVSTISPFFKINFNKPLSTHGLSVSSSYSVATSYKIEGKVLVVTLNSPMTADYSYYIKIGSISDTAGDKLENKVFSFIPKYVASQALPKDQQQALLQTQAQRPKSKDNVTFNDTGALINDGITITQLDELEQELFTFNSNARTVTINQSSVVAVPHDRNSASTSDTINFSVKIDAKTYNARIDYSLLDDSIRLYLYTPSNNALVFDSANPPVGGAE